MSYGQPLTHQSLNGQMNGSNGTQANGRVNGASLDSQVNGAPGGPLSGLKAVDPEQLKARLYSYAPQQASVNPKVLRFNRVTQTQMRKSNIPTAPKLEPVPSLQKYQERNQPDFIHRRNKERIEAEKLAKMQADEPQKGMKRKSFVAPPLGAPPSPLPDLPDDLQQKQDALGPRTPTPAKQSKSSTPRGRVHASGPVIPPSTKPKLLETYEGLQDTGKITDLIKENERIGFLYLSPAVPKSSVDYHYYNLRVVNHENINKTDHCTISQKGVTRIRSDDETEFVTLDRWELEYNYFRKLVKIPTFALFRKWKAFNVWRGNVKSKKIAQCKKALNNNLFIVNPSLRPALMNVREMCHRISDMGLCKVEKGHTYSLREFNEAQFTQLSEVAGRLMEFRDLVKEVVRSACRTALLEAGFTPDDYFYDGGESPGEFGGAPGTASSYLMQSNYDMDIYGEAPDKMTFIRLADYLIVNTMHVLAVNSVSTLLNYLTEQLQNTPTLAQIQGLEDENQEEGGKTEEEKDEDEIPVLPPLYITEFVLEPNQLLFSPDIEEFQEGIAEVIKRFQDAVLSVQNLVPDTYFDAFTRPIINNKFEEKMCGEGPSLSTMFEDDKHLQTIIHSIREAITAAFRAASQYADTFETHREFYKDNESTDLDVVRNEDHEVSWFSEALERYYGQRKLAEQIKEKRPIGMLLVDGTNMKKLIIPSPLRCLDVVNDMLPKLARKEVDRLIAELQDAQFRLESVPSTTIEFVKSLTFLDEVQVRIEPLEKESMIVKDMYDLIDVFQVPTPLEDFAVYQTLGPSITNVRNAIDKSLADRDANIDRFCTHLDKDIAELAKEVKEVKQEAQNPIILDANADKEKVKQVLKKLLTQMDDLQERAFTYKSYQKNFKVEVTKFDALEEAHAELKLKDLLWNAIDEWDGLLTDWTQV
ncbi:DYH6-like protein [Mya arenaria]|uniref:DYH6-like protein n=1 Tax=Mya arenaria TaxID=6604 RepID=A0ABY7G890_MYAAR|nr:DYH6-like protein [Mya arenaria]